jgi:hypothetical protein
VPENRSRIDALQLALAARCLGGARRAAKADISADFQVTMPPPGSPPTISR